MTEIERGQVITVNEQDAWTGTMEKLQAHKEGVLHRAFSVFVLNDKNEMLLQQRALDKYHSGGLWTNACCSHPAPGEGTIAAAHRRLMEEMGFDCDLQPLFELKYKADVGGGLTEHEYDHIYMGVYSGEVTPNAEEVADYRYIAMDDLLLWLKEKPQDFTTWFNLAMPRFIELTKASS
ncbi:MAG: isopentenyl-diphosphate Delta-isomerase [Sphingobacteriales bacterium]|nr:MAG: isopentenyl-diphosphate Delta-isomerase [Sphingobacteriales bacterium]